MNSRSSIVEQKKELVENRVFFKNINFVLERLLAEHMKHFAIVFFAHTPSNRNKSFACRKIYTNKAFAEVRCIVNSLTCNSKL